MTPDYAALRRNMVDTQLRPADITSHAILERFSAVPRELFVPKSKRPFAYGDKDLLIWDDEETENKRYLIRPAPFARLVQAAAIRPKDFILDIAVGAGYSTAILSALCEGVVAIEAVPELVESATNNLSAADVDNAVVLEGALERGYPKEAPYDIIVINGVAEQIPDALFDQLTPEGKLLCFSGQGACGNLMLFTKTESGRCSWPVINAAAPHVTEFTAEAGFVF